MDIDTTVKPLYGHQEDAQVGDNPSKPGRPSHAYHRYFIANLRMVMEVEVPAGNQTAASYAQPGMWEMLASELRLKGWSPARRVVVLRRPLRHSVAEGEKTSKRKRAKPMTLDLGAATHLGVSYESAVLVTSMGGEVRAIGQHDRDRGDSENNFDELKNQWGWAGFTTQDRKRCPVMARITALIYNWWTIFMRLGTPDKHAEAVTSRPLALHGIARRTRHANQTTVAITSTHAKASLITEALTRVSGFLKQIKVSAEQLPQPGRWRLILSEAFRVFLHGKVLGSTPRMAAAPA